MITLNMTTMETTTIENSTVHALISSGIDWGPKRDPLYIVIPVTILYTLIFIAGVAGNISTCIVIGRNKSMHTATNYYLFSLAISDLLLLICGLPTEMYSIWWKYPYVFGEAFCVIQGFAAETSANATVLTITAFTVERYVAICHPFLSHTMSKLSRAVKFIVAVWIVAMCLAIPQAMSFEIIYGDMDWQYVCSVETTLVPHAFEVSTVLFFVAPMSLITVLYVLIGLQLHKSTVGPSRGNSVRLKHRVSNQVANQTKITLNGGELVQESGGAGAGARGNEEDGRKNFARNAQATKHVVKMLVAVVVAFFICWAPFHAQRLLAIYGKHTSENMVTAFRVLTYISGILYFLSTSINPFLYHLMSHKFREAFKDTFRRNRRNKGNTCYSTLSGRSSQVNSHSDSCGSRQSSLRYLEAEMARLHDSKRPLVVSFKRKRSPYLKKPKQVTILDADLQEALDHLNEETKGRDNGRTAHDFTYVEVHNLKPTHICPLNPSCVDDSHTEDYRNDESMTTNNRRRRRIPSGRKVRWDCRDLPKSCTMPDMDVDEEYKDDNCQDNDILCLNVSREERSNSCSLLEFNDCATDGNNVINNDNVIITCK